MHSIGRPDNKLRSK